MYLHIGMHMYLRKERVIGIFPGVLLQQNHDEQPFLTQTTLVAQDVPADDAKSCILTKTNELYLSNVNARTLKQRWNTHKT
jgi:hypothetical protein